MPVKGITPMAKRNHAATKVIGAAVLGAIAYALFNPKTGKKMRAEISRSAKDFLRKSKDIGKLSKETYADAIETAARMYQKTHSLTRTQLSELGDLAEELKISWAGAKKKKKRKW